MNVVGVGGSKRRLSSTVESEQMMSPPNQAMSIHITYTHGRGYANNQQKELKAVVPKERDNGRRETMVAMVESIYK